jgi:ketosteroid isomerase-like protein
MFASLLSRRDTGPAMSDHFTPPDLREIMRRQVEAVNRRDLDALMSIVAPDAVYDTSPSGLGVYEGPEAISAFFNDYWGAFDELRFALEELLDLGGGVVFTVQRQYARPAGSGATVEAREAHVQQWAGGMVQRVTVYTDIDEARGAAERLAEGRGERS